MPARTFVDGICKPLKLVETWEGLMLRKFGCVARDSPAFHRVIANLRTAGGLRQVAAVAATGTQLHGSGPNNVGIQECHLIKQEMERCHAGGLPPPAVAPGAQKQEAAAEECAQVVPAGTGDDDEVAAAEFAALSGGGPGVAEGAGQAPPSLAAEVAKDLAEVRLNADWPALLGEAHVRVQAAGARTLFVVDCPTSRISVLGRALNAAYELWDKASKPQRFRVLVMCHSRLELVAKAAEKVCRGENSLSPRVREQQAVGISIGAKRSEQEMAEIISIGSTRQDQAEGISIGSRREQVIAKRISIGSQRQKDTTYSTSLQ
jgi:hypothetical protein